MENKPLAIVSNLPLLKKLHIGAAFAIVVLATINAGIPGFVFTGIWMAFSFSEKTRWLFYGMLLVQAWSNWHIIGLVLSAGFIAFCVSRNIAYKKRFPDSAVTAGDFRTTAPTEEGALFSSEEIKEREEAAASAAWQEQKDRDELQDSYERLARGERGLLEE